MEKITAIQVLDVPVHPYSMDAAVQYLDDKIQEQKHSFVVTANAEIIMMCQDDAEYKNILTNVADLVLPDGAGTGWAGRQLGYAVPERVAGLDLFNRLLNLAAEKGYRVFFFGASPGIAEAAKKKAESLYPGVTVVGCRDGYFKDSDNKSIIDAINNSGAQILFIALGAPKQEKWLQTHLQELKPYITMGIGGSFDVLAGKMERAPLWMQKYSLEWLFRLYKQPSRFTRMLALPKFVIKVICSK